MGWAKAGRLQSRVNGNAFACVAEIIDQTSNAGARFKLAQFTIEDEFNCQRILASATFR